MDERPLPRHVAAALKALRASGCHDYGIHGLENGRQFGAWLSYGFLAMQGRGLYQKSNWPAARQTG